MTFLQQNLVSLGIYTLASKFFMIIKFHFKLVKLYMLKNVVYILRIIWIRTSLISQSMSMSVFQRDGEETGPD